MCEPSTPQASGFLGNVSRPRVSRVLSRGRYSRRRWQAGWIVLHHSALVRAKRGRGRDGKPLKWTGGAGRPEWVIEANPDHNAMTAVTSLRKQAEVPQAQAAQKSR